MSGVGGTTAGVRPLTRRAAEVMLPAASGAWHERDRTRAEIAPVRPLYLVRPLKGGDALTGHEPLWSIPSPYVKRGWTVARWWASVRRGHQGRERGEHNRLEPRSPNAVHPLRCVRLQTIRRSFWDDQSWVPLKMILLAALVLLAALL